MTKPTTLGELRQTEWASPARIHRTVKDELRQNLICLLENGSALFPGIVGYQDTVIPQLVNALMSRHNFILLGLRGQAKSRILRQLVTLLDEEIPILAGSEVNDNPFAPISKFGRELVAEHAERAPITWLPREMRYVEKLATPDVTIADIIGDVDPIKAARGGHLLSDELTMHFGLLPRTNRGIFAINELPDLAGKIQVGLFNIMQEGEVQVKGYPVRLNLYAALGFLAAPPDQRAGERGGERPASQGRHQGEDGGPPHLGHLRRAARDHGQARARVRRRAAGSRIDRQGPDPPRRRQDVRGPGGRRQRGRHRPLVR